jgi:hypothetical protein
MAGGGDCDYPESSGTVYSAPERLRETAVLTSPTSPKTIVGSTFQGDPPRDFLEYITNTLCEINFDGIDGHIAHNCIGEIEFFPRTYILAQRDELLQDLRNGKIPSLQYTDLIKLDPKIADPEQFAGDQLEGYVITLHNSMISKAYIDNLANAIKSNLEGRGWVHVEVSASTAPSRVSALETLLRIIPSHTIGAN